MNSRSLKHFQAIRSITTWAACLSMAAILCVVLDGAGSVRAQAIDSQLWGVDNSVFALARLGDTLYVGGAFTRAGRSTGGAVALPRNGAAPRTTFPAVTGYVYSIAADGHGGWFLAGNFTAVAGVPRYCLAHVLADGTVAPWNPNPNFVSYGAGGWLLVSDNTVYVSGGFATISGKSRVYVAALDATTGEALDFDARANGLLAPLAIRGDTLYVGGYFTQIGGQPRNNIAALDARTGDALSWNPNADGGVGPIVLSDTTAFVGGVFTHIGGQARVGFAELDLRTGMATGWSPTPATGNSAIQAMSVLGHTLYVGGVFDSLSGQPRRCLGAFDLRNRRLTAWDPQPGTSRGVPGIDCIHAVDRSVYVCGFINAVGGASRNFVAELDTETGLATAWNPDPINNVFSITTDDSAVYLGGWFQSYGMAPRHNLAAFDLKTGLVTDWNPNPDGLIVYALTAAEGKIYVGGDFSQLGGAARNDLAAVDPTTGIATGFTPNPDQVVKTLLVRHGTVYAGGAFDNIGGRPRRCLAALDASTGDALDWNPAPNDWVGALAMRGDTLYAGGFFSQVGGQPHYSIAAVDAATGAVLPWQIDTDGVVNALAVGGSAVFAGGGFDHVLGGPPRINLLAFDATTGQILDWAPSPNGPREDANHATVDALATRGDTLYVGGDFTTIAGGQRASLAVLDGASGALLNWAPEPDQSVHAFEVSGDQLYAGGYFRAASWRPHLGLLGAAFPHKSAPPDSLPVGPTVTFAPIQPNPIQSTASVRYSLPISSTVTLSLYDILGRRVASVVDRQFQNAGVHRLTIGVDRLKSGCYFIRLEAGQVTRTQKVVVLR